MKIRHKAQKKSSIMPSSKILKENSQIDNITVIKHRLASLNHQQIKKALIEGGMYDKNMNLTPSFE